MLKYVEPPRWPMKYPISELAPVLPLVDAVKPTWGEPLKSDRLDSVCNAEWASVPLHASVAMIFDDRKTGSDIWRVYLYLSVSPDAASPSEWRK